MTSKSSPATPTPRTTSRHYDLGNDNDYKHPVHQIAARLAV